MYQPHAFSALHHRYPLHYSHKLFSFEVLILSPGRQLADSSVLADKCRDILPDTGQGSHGAAARRYKPITLQSTGINISGA